MWTRSTDGRLRRWRCVAGSSNGKGHKIGGGAGFTLLEVVVAIAVLGIAFVGLMGLHNRNLRLAIREQSLSSAALLAQELMTRTQTQGPAAAGLSQGDFADAHPGLDPQFHWRREIRSTAIEGLWEIRVEVLHGDSKECELTYFTQLDS